MKRALFLGNKSGATSTDIEYIEKYGNIEYAVFDDIKEAICYLEKYPYSIVFFEHEIPDWEFDDVYSSLKQFGFGGAFIVITADEDSDIISNMYKSGVSAVLAKPFDYEVFSAVLRYYEEQVESIASGKISEGFWIPISRIFTRKGSKLSVLVQNQLDKGDFTAKEISTKLKQPLFLVSQCLNELVLSKAVMSYVKKTEDGAIRRYFTKDHL